MRPVQLVLQARRVQQVLQVPLEQLERRVLQALLGPQVRPVQLVQQARRAQ